MSDRALALPVTLILASLSIACGEKGDGSPDETGGSAGTFSTGGSVSSGGTGGGSGGSGGASEAMRLYGFDTTIEGFKYEIYTNPDFENLGADSTLTWDEGAGSDEAPGRLKLDVPFAAYSQLADIQLNIPVVDWSGKTLRARVMIESGFSPDESAPGGAYIFAKAIDPDYIWAKGTDQNMLPSTFGNWITLSFALDTPAQENPGFDATQVVSLGIQFYTGSPPDPTGLAAPTPAVIYVDEFTLQ